MAVVKTARPRTESEEVVERAKDFWSRYGKMVSIALGAIIVVVGGFLIYKNFIQGPKEKKAADAIFRAEQYFRQDSLDKALNGDGQAMGLEKIASQYGGTAVGERAKYMAGAIYVKKGNFDKAITYLKDVDTDAPQVQARAYKLLGDAYSEKGNAKEALNFYKKAGHHFEDDELISSEALFLAAYLSDKVLNDKNGAIELYKEVKTKYGRTQWASEAEKYLAANGVYNVD
ncbi:MAG: tetratricopeptide repeat protein [Chitinophagaceae bacterium]|nr:MAG: tetratricopeptide repeat protein [Chitinophagaceae bacterium]